MIETAHEELVARLPLFQALPPEAVRQLAAALRRSTVAAGTLLMREGEPGATFLVLLAGEVEVVKALGNQDERVLARRGVGDVLGEMSLLNPDGRRTASVRAITPVELLEMRRADFATMLEQQPRLVTTLLHILSERLRESESASVRDLEAKNRQLERAYAELQAAQARLIEQESLARELHIARPIQQALLPKQRPVLAGWEFATSYRPARVVGGDFYDFVPLPDGRLGLVIGDVAGASVPAALLMASTRSTLRGVAHPGGSPGAVLAEVNNLICPDVPPGLFVTAFYAILEPVTGRLRYANAGQTLPFHRRANGALTELRMSGWPLGWLPGMRYDEGETWLLPDDLVLFISDGLVEAHNPQREMFGTPRLRSLIERAERGAAGAALIDHLLAGLAAFTGLGWEQEDDLTLMTLRRQAGAARHGYESGDR